MHGAFYLSVWPARSADSKRSGGARGDQYVEATLITDQVEAGIDSLSELAPLHNPACLAGIRGAREVLGSSVPMVAVFDTAFHQTMPNVAKQYALRVGLSPGHGLHISADASRRQRMSLQPTKRRGLP